MHCFCQYEKSLLEVPILLEQCGVLIKPHARLVVESIKIPVIGLRRKKRERGAFVNVREQWNKSSPDFHIEVLLDYFLQILQIKSI